MLSLTGVGHTGRSVFHAPGNCGSAAVQTVWLSEHHTLGGLHSRHLLFTVLVAESGKWGFQCGQILVMQAHGHLLTMPCAGERAKSKLFGSRLYKDTNPILMTSYKPNFLPKAPL